MTEAAERWRIRLLGGFDLHDGRDHLTRLPSRAVTALLARLALWPERAHPREELVELLWPGVDLAVGRNRLRQALSTLKAVLEPPGPVTQRVLLADRLSLRVVPGSLACDARQFERLLREHRHGEARALYRGELLPGFYDDWIGDERARLAALFERCGADMAMAGQRAAPAAAPARPLQAAPAPPALPDLARASIPHYLTRFFGADAQACRLSDRVLGHRLVTLVGPGGSGKTRLAVELAHGLRDGPRATVDKSTGHGFDLVAFVPLVGCGSADELVDALLAAFLVRAGSGDAFGRIVQALVDRHVLLVLDNFEQLDAAAAAVVARLAATLPQLHQLVTSRRVLGLDGEQEFRVEALELPAPGVDLDGAAGNPAVALFVDRARSARPDFHLGRTNVDSITALVHALDGMPLAIELAASRVRAFTPDEMLARLTGTTSASATALELLARAGPRAGQDRRHASMQAAIEWSWQLLDDAHSTLLAGLTVFTGGCSAEAAATVCGDGRHDTRLLLDGLRSHSLIEMRDSGAEGGPRISLAEPLREFAAQRLDPQHARVLRLRHRQWWLHWAEGFGPTPPLGRVRQELPNIVAALASAVADGAPQDAVRIVLALSPAFNEILLPAGGMAHLSAALEQVEDPALRSRGHSFLGVLCFEAGEGAAAQHHAEIGLALAPADELAVRARALHAAASVRWRSTRNASGLAPLLDEAAALADRSGEGAISASVDALRAFIANVVDRDFARGEALHRKALDKWQRLGNLHAINGGVYNLAICAFNGRRWDEALQRLEAVCHTAREHEDWEQLSDALNVLGNTRAEQRDWPAALHAYQECVRVAWGSMETHALAYGLWNLPQTLAHLRRPADAARLMSFAAHFWERRFGALSSRDQPYLRRARRLVSVQLGRTRWDTLWAEGAAMSLGAAVRLALGAQDAGAGH